MLTKQDFSEIGKIIDKKLLPIKEDIHSIKKNVVVLKKDTKKIKDDVSTLIRVFDDEDVYLGRRVTQIEKHLNIRPLARDI